jgi:hypothetical protein
VSARHRTLGLAVIAGFVVVVALKDARRDDVSAGAAGGMAERPALGVGLGWLALITSTTSQRTAS